MTCLSLDMARGEWMRKEYRIRGGGGGERQKNNEKRREEEIEKNLYQQEE